MFKTHKADNEFTGRLEVRFNIPNIQKAEDYGLNEDEFMKILAQKLANSHNNLSLVRSYGGVYKFNIHDIDQESLDKDIRSFFRVLEDEELGFLEIIDGATAEINQITYQTYHVLEENADNEVFLEEFNFIATAELLEDTKELHATWETTNGYVVNRYELNANNLQALGVFVEASETYSEYGIASMFNGLYNYVEHKQGRIWTHMLRGHENTEVARKLIFMGGNLGTELSSIHTGEVVVTEELLQQYFEANNIRKTFRNTNEMFWYLVSIADGITNFINELNVA